MLELSSLSSLTLDTFYLCTTTLHVRPLTTSKNDTSQDKDVTVQYILELFEVRQSSLHRMIPVKYHDKKFIRREKEDWLLPLIKGYIHGLSRGYDLTRFTGFKVTHVHETPEGDFLKEHGLPESTSLYSIQHGAIDSMRLIEPKDGPLVMNWFYLSEEIKTYLFNK